MDRCFFAGGVLSMWQPAGMRARQRGSFLLRAQELAKRGPAHFAQRSYAGTKVTKEKGTLPCSVRPERADYPAELVP